ncbi:MAG TPA: hypothetical protein VFL53_21315 [Pseudolabrys sp.]|jgi:hypothetical protein|nr:hypothetical protein [Pseudolabrys sp.]
MDGGNAIGPRRRAVERDARSDRAAAYLESLVQRVAVASTDEIAEVIRDLRRMRDALHGKSERWNGDVAGYARLNQSVMVTMKLIGENLRRGKVPRTREQTLADLKVRLLGGDTP